MTPSDTFFDLVNTQFVPLLRAEGFRGSGRTFRRQRNECVQIVNLQTSNSGGRCAVNLAVGFTFMNGIDADNVNQEDCDFRRRLCPDADQTDHWWNFGDGAGATQASVSNLIETYSRRGIPFFTRFGEFPGVYADVSVEDIRTPSKGKLPGGTTNVRNALAFARICLHLKQHAKAKEFLLYGLEVCGPMAAGIRGQIKQLMREIEPSISGDGKPAPQP